MNKIQRILYQRLTDGDPKLRALFKEYVETMGHSAKEAEVIVESVLEDKDLLQENLADTARYERKDS